MPSKEIPFYRENHTKRVTYEVSWLDPTFSDWLELVYGSSKEALDRWASVVSITPADETALSLPSGGRVLVYNLPRPYPDPISGLPCYQIDVKGVGLTKSGYLQDGDCLEGDRRELMYHPSRDFYYGYEDLPTQKQTARQLNLVRRRQHHAPIPLAVLAPKQMVLDGQNVSIKRLNRKLSITGESYGLIIRGYPVSATRIGDLNSWHGGFRTPMTLSVSSKTLFGVSLDIEQETLAKHLQKLNWARKMWNKHELPKILTAGNGQFDKNPGWTYFTWFKQIAVNEVLKIFATGLSPLSGQEDWDVTATHTHLQNYSTANVLVEWTPLTRLDQVPFRPPHFYRAQHALEIIEAQHDALVNIGACCLNENNLRQIPLFNAFFAIVCQILQERRLTSEALIRQMRLHHAKKTARGDHLISFVLKHKLNLISAY